MHNILPITNTGLSVSVQVDKRIFFDIKEA